jgi:hypothetical protein
MLFWFALIWLQLTFGSLVGKLYNRDGVEEMYHICTTATVERSGRGDLQALYNWETVDKPEI